MKRYCESMILRKRDVQQSHFSKEEAASPTVALESVFVMSTIDARENREVMKINTLGVFLHFHK